MAQTLPQKLSLAKKQIHRHICIVHQIIQKIVAKNRKRNAQIIQPNLLYILYNSSDK